ncbi:MAG: hypothetical protein O3B13_19465 [Planctomycetota bacterium]|nr:hypothetical protein [Planctomycetota bacterium]
MSDVISYNQPDDESLSWLAFRYVSGEMADGELSEFEARLDSGSEAFELAACEAVATAVQLGDAVVAALEPASWTLDSAISTPVSDERPSSSGRRGSFSRRVSMTASAVAVVAVGWLLTTSVSVTKVAVDISDRTCKLSDDGVSVGASEMVRIWADSVGEVGEVGEVGSNVDEQLLVSTVDVPTVFNADVPDWLLAALQSQQDAANGLTGPEVLEN